MKNEKEKSWSEIADDLSQEKKDLASLLDKQIKIKLECYSFMQLIHKMNETDLKHSGFKSIGEGLTYAIVDAEKKLKAEVALHLKKWPD